MTYASPTTINGSLGFGEVLNYINNVTNNWISIMFLMAIYIIVLVGYYKAQDDFKGALAVAGYGTFIVAFLFWLGGFVMGWTLGVAIGLAVIGTFVLLMDNS